MWHELVLRPVFVVLAAVDEQLADLVRRQGCPCGGPLHRADYLRKPRGGLLASAGEEFRRRRSFCCGREGCRKRALPPSVLFLGRRVYLEAVVLLACLRVLLVKGEEKPDVPAKTLRRWLAWWTSDLPTAPTWQLLRARFMPPIDEAVLPLSLLERVASVLEPPDLGQVLLSAGRWLAPLTTRSVQDVARFVWVG